MAYRTKIYNILTEKYIMPVLKFIGLTVDKSNEISMLAWVGDSEDEVFDYRKHKLVKSGQPRWFINDKRDPYRIYTFIESQDEYLRYRKNSEKLEYFNPFAKWANTQQLLMLMIPSIYERYCKTEESDGEEDYIDELLYDQVVVTQEELLKAINIKYYPIEMDPDTGEKIYHYEINIKRDNGEENNIVSKSKNRCVCIMMLMIDILSIIDDVFDVDRLQEIQEELEVLIEKYMKERELNFKDLKKVKIDRDLGLTTVETPSDGEVDIFETMDVEDLVNSSNNMSDNNEMDGYVNNDKPEEPTNNPIDITDMYKNDMMLSMHEDDMLMQLQYDFV